jgi:hypothetical protein
MPHFFGHTLVRTLLSTMLVHVSQGDYRSSEGGVYMDDMKDIEELMLL